jgi:hypothetical protein
MNVYVGEGGGWDGKDDGKEEKRAGWGMSGGKTRQISDCCTLCAWEPLVDYILDRQWRWERPKIDGSRVDTGGCKARHIRQCSAKNSVDLRERRVLLFNLHAIVWKFMIDCSSQQHKGRFFHLTYLRRGWEEGRCRLLCKRPSVRLRDKKGWRVSKTTQEITWRRL